MHRLRSALLAVATAGATIAFAPSARAQEAAVTGPCAQPDSIAFTGNQRISDQLLRGDAAIVPGAPLNVRAVERAIKNLYATGQFEDVRVACDRTVGKTVLTFTLRERPILQDVDVRGADRVSPSEVRDRVDILIGRPVDPAQVAKDVARIDSLYEANGYYLARVHVDTTRTAANEAKLVFRVDEGRRLAISGVRINGNKALSDKTIVAAMQTKPEGFLWWKKGEFDENKFAADIAEKLPALYGSHGYIDMQVVRDTLIVDRALGKGLIEITVNEGPQYRIGDFDVVGAKAFPSDVLNRFYPFGDKAKSLKQTVTGIFHRHGEPQDVFNRAAWDNATQDVRKAYANEGYIYAQINPVVERVRSGADSTPTVNLRWDIEEFTPAIVNRVDIEGNNVTIDNCIRDQIVMVPGDVFSQDRLIQSYQSISNLGFFDSPLPEPETKRANDQGDIDIVFKVKEKNTGNVNFGASVGQGYGVGGFIGFDQPNLFGKCKRGSLQWQFGRYINDFNLSYTDPRIRESRISGTVTAYNSRSQYTVGNLGQIKRVGGQVRFGFPVPGSRWTRIFLDYGGETVKYGESGLAGSINCGQNGAAGCFRSTAGATIDRDTRFDMPFPSSGVHQSLQSEFTGGPLGGTAAFQRYVAEMRSYSTLATLGGDNPGSQPIKLVFGLSTRMGALFGNPGPFFTTQSFSLGGVQYGEMLRGYEEFSITPHGYLATGSQFTAEQSSFGNAFFTNTAELGVRFNQQLYLDAFYDAGNIWARPRDFNPTRLFRGAGVGASLVTPLGPLGIDLGYGFDRVNSLGQKDPKWQVHFKFGQIFY